ncbi:MAG: SusE domain-containing protein [Candidatus Cryptobacteroides sp.]
MKTNILRISAATAAAIALLNGCSSEIDHAYSRFPSVMQMTASSQNVVLDESAPDEVALRIEWTAAKNYGEDFIMTYKYEWNLAESKVSAKSEYEDMGIFVREYTNLELQTMLIDDFDYKTSTWGTMQFTATADYDGGNRVVLPDQASITVRVKTYGAKQFAADRIYIGGSAVPGERIELSPSANNASVYIWNGSLQTGKVNFPVIYGDEENVIVPASGSDEDASADASAAAIESWSANSPGWIIPSAEPYRVTLNMDSRTVTIVAQADILEIDKIFLSGSALEEEIEFEQTIENEAVYAWKGELKAGILSFPIEYEGQRALTIVPSREETDLLDGQADPFSSASSVTATGRGWTIPADGQYRVVLDTEAKTVTIYSEATDVKNKTVIFKRTAGTANDNYTMEVTRLWIFGGNVYYSGSKPKGEPYVLEQSLANPRLFIYKGETLKADKIKFLVSDNWNNEYAFGSGQTRDYIASPVLGAKNSPLYGGQGDNRYAWFNIPADTNYIEVYIGDESTDEHENALSKNFSFEGSYVIFDKR